MNIEDHSGQAKKQTWEQARLMLRGAAAQAQDKVQEINEGDSPGGAEANKRSMIGKMRQIKVCLHLFIS